MERIRRLLSPLTDRGQGQAARRAKDQDAGDDDCEAERSGRDFGTHARTAGRHGVPAQAPHPRGM